MFYIQIVRFVSYIRNLVVTIKIEIKQKIFYTFQNYSLYFLVPRSLGMQGNHIDCFQKSLLLLFKKYFILK
jgi:hypothetical protein